MRSFLFAVSALAIVGLAFWAYRENYATQQSLRDVRALHEEIGAARTRLAVLNAEWAYLNRPDRLRDLVELNFDRLELLPLAPEAFGRVDQVAYPPKEIDFEAVTQPVEISSDGEWP